MPQLGSTRGMSSNSIAGLNDATGESVISTSNEFAASPLGIAARTQALFGIPNSNFTLLPPEPETRLLDGENPLPYWSVLEDSDGRITANSTLNTATNTWGVVLDPSSGTAINTDTLTMTTRSYVITDDNLGVRQKAFLSMSKSGTAGGTASQWNITMQAEYFDALGASLSGGTPYVIGTALDTATFTTINGFTVSGGSAIPAAAQYVDLSVILTATGTVTGSAKATLTSLLIQTSAGAAASQSFVITEQFTSSGTWTRPTGVNYLLAVIAAGAGGGGGSGGARHATSTATRGVSTGGGGGGSGAWVLAQNFYVGDQVSISYGIGAAGTGGAGAGSAGTALRSSNGNAGAAGGATTFGTYITAGGGGGGAAGTTASAADAGTAGVSGGTAGTASAIIFGYTVGTALGANSGVNVGTASQTAGTAGTAAFGAVTVFPYYPVLVASTTGAAGTVTGGGGGGTAANGAVSTGAVGGGGGGGVGRVGSTNASTLASAGGNAAGGSGPGGGGAAARNSPSVVVASAGGTAAEYSAGGGGGSGGAASNSVDFTNVDCRSQKGGDGALGFVVIAYVA